MTYQRPSGTYAGAGGLSNRTKYQDDSAANTAISSAKVDGDINYIIDGLNTLDDTLTEANPSTNPTTGTIAANDKLVFADVDDGDALKTTTAQAILDLLGSISIPSGSVQAFAGSSAPSGWLFCYGQAISRTTYADLFSAIGTTHGAGNGSTTFNVPDMRGRAVFGKDDMGGSAVNRITNAVSGITATNLGETGGNQNMHSHTHTTTVTDAGHSHFTVNSESSGAALVGSGGLYEASNFVYNGGSSTVPAYGKTSTDETGISVAVNAAGSGGSQNMPPAIILNWIIKT